VHGARADGGARGARRPAHRSGTRAHPRARDGGRVPHARGVRVGVLPADVDGPDDAGVVHPHALLAAGLVLTPDPTPGETLIEDDAHIILSAPGVIPVTDAPAPPRP